MLGAFYGVKWSAARTASPANPEYWRADRTRLPSTVTKSLFIGGPNCGIRRCQLTVPGGSIDRHDVETRDTDNRTGQKKVAVAPDARGDRGSTRTVRPAHLAGRVTRDLCGVASGQDRREMDTFALDRRRWSTGSSAHFWHGW